VIEVIDLDCSLKIAAAEKIDLILIDIWTWKDLELIASIRQIDRCQETAIAIRSINIINRSDC